MFIAGEPRQIAELQELLDAGFTFAEVDSREGQVMVTMARGSERETLTFGVEAAAHLWASGLLDNPTEGEEGDEASLLTLQGMLRDGFSITSIASTGQHVQVTLRHGEHRETLKLPAHELVALAPTRAGASQTSSDPTSNATGAGTGPEGARTQAHARSDPEK